MAKVTITIEDMPDGTVKADINPSFETLAKMAVSGHELTSAEGYAIACANAMRKESKKAGPIQAMIPRLGR